MALVLIASELCAIRSHIVETDTALREVPMYKVIHVAWLSITHDRTEGIECFRKF